MSPNGAGAGAGGSIMPNFIPARSAFSFILLKSHALNSLLQLNRSLNRSLNLHQSEMQRGKCSIESKSANEKITSKKKKINVNEKE